MLDRATKSAMATIMIAMVEPTRGILAAVWPAKPIDQGYVRRAFGHVPMATWCAMATWALQLKPAMATTMTVMAEPMKTWFVVAEAAQVRVRRVLKPVLPANGESVKVPKSPDKNCVMVRIMTVTAGLMKETLVAV